MLRSAAGRGAARGSAACGKSEGRGEWRRRASAALVFLAKRFRCARQLGLDVECLAAFCGELAIVGVELGALAGVKRLAIGSDSGAAEHRRHGRLGRLRARRRLGAPIKSFRREMVICIEPVRRLQSISFSVALISYWPSDVTSPLSRGVRALLFSLNGGGE